MEKAQSARPISKLEVVPEQYEVDHYNRMDYSGVNSEMTEMERRFINGLIRAYRPANILEIGVARGGGSINILNAIRDYPARLTSIDRITYDHYAPDIQLAADALKVFPNAREENWRLFSGADASTVLPQLNEKFDFVVMDSLHLHPVEALNFLSFFPFLSEGAIMIMHDINVFWGGFHRLAGRNYAPRILSQAIVGDKLYPLTYDERPNIAAIQITGDTRRYISNVLESLYLPWEVHGRMINGETFEAGDLVSVRNVIEQHYSKGQLALYDDALQYQRFLKDMHFMFGPEGFTQIHEAWNGLPPSTVFYGGGGMMRFLLSLLELNGLGFDCRIWDANAGQISDIQGKQVQFPDYSTKAIEGTVMVVTIQDKAAAEEVARRFSPLGYKVYHGLSHFIEERLNASNCIFH